MIKQVLVPDIGAFSNVDVIEVLVQAGDRVSVDASLITLETDKATLEIPSPYAGIVKNIDLKVGDKVSEGSVILSMEISGAGSDKEGTVETSEEIKEKAVETSKGDKNQKESQTETETQKTETQKQTHRDDEAEKETHSRHSSHTSKDPSVSKITESEGKASGGGEAQGTITSGYVHAGPGVRRFARELGVDLTKIQGTGFKKRILVKDVQGYVKHIVTTAQRDQSAQGNGGLGFAIAPWPKVEYAKFGPVKIENVSRIKKLSGSYLHRNWVMVPHVTQFDEADITALEQFRKENQTLAEQQGIKLTPLVFIMKAVVAALRSFPNFNASLDEQGGQLILKQYFHIGVAVDTPNGLVVPVVRNVDQKGLFQLAKELGEISQKARLGQLTAQDMQGSSFSISSLGGIGGTAFTPIINVPDVAILGVSRSQMKPVFLDGEFKPCLMLPLSLSYDHRVIDGAEAARFTTFLVKQLTDIRRLLF